MIKFNATNQKISIEGYVLRLHRKSERKTNRMNWTCYFRSSLQMQCWYRLCIRKRWFNYGWRVRSLLHRNLQIPCFGGKQCKIARIDWQIAKNPIDSISFPIGICTHSFNCRLALEIETAHKQKCCFFVDKSHRKNTDYHIWTIP